MRRMLENATSKIGTARMRSGKYISEGPLFIMPVILSVASIKPAKSAPESPINIFAGL